MRGPLATSPELHISCASERDDGRDRDDDPTLHYHLRAPLQPNTPTPLPNQPFKGDSLPRQLTS
eukprot:6870845-Pyramimonas_sp.AAC.1